MTGDFQFRRTGFAAAFITFLFIALDFLITRLRRFIYPEFSEALGLSQLAIWYSILILILLALYPVLRWLQTRSFVTVAIVTVFLAITSGVSEVLLFRAFGSWTGGEPFGLESLFWATEWWMHFYFAWCAAILALHYSRRRRGEQQKRSEAERLAHGAQIRALRYRLNPHFLFNALNSIAALVVEQRAVAAERLIRGLSEHVRTTLRVDPMTDQLLRTEIAQQRAYLAIERVRFPDRLRTAFSMSEELADALVPPFILQPLIEDAVRHGVAPSRGITRLTVEARREGNLLALRITESHEQALPEFERQGFARLQSRLRQRFGTEYELSVEHASEGLQCTKLNLPLRRSTAATESEGAKSQ